MPPWISKNYARCGVGLKVDIRTCLQHIPDSALPDQMWLLSPHDFYLTPSQQITWGLAMILLDYNTGPQYRTTIQDHNIGPHKVYSGFNSHFIIYHPPTLPTPTPRFLLIKFVVTNFFAKKFFWQHPLKQHLQKTKGTPRCNQWKMIQNCYWRFWLLKLCYGDSKICYFSKD